MALMGVSLSLLMCYNEHTEAHGLVEVDLSTWTYLVLIILCRVLGLCHSFKVCALPPSLLFQIQWSLLPDSEHNRGKNYFSDITVSMNSSCGQYMMDMQ